MPFSHLVSRRQEMQRKREQMLSTYGETSALSDVAQRQPGESGRQGGDLRYWCVYSMLPTNIRCFTNRTNSHSGPSTCINECRVPELMDLTSPVTRKVLRLRICSTEVQCQRVPVWSHVQREKVQQFIDGNAFYVLQSASGEGNRVRQAGGG